MQELQNLHKQIRNCERCTKLCPWKKFKDEDYGNLNSKIMIVSEAPGEISINNNQSWSGPAGKRLKKITAPLGSIYEIFYLTNVVKCLPPKNRDPTKEELKNCSDYAIKEIELVNPHIIFVIGRFAMNLVFDIYGIEKKPITQLHGKEIKTNGKVIIPLYHPSYASVWSKTYDKDVFDLVKRYHTK